MRNRATRRVCKDTIGGVGDVLGKASENTALLFSPPLVNMSDGKKESGSLPHQDTSGTAITFSKEKKAFWSFLWKCWRKCFGKKSQRK